jgi:hypothetical protein
MLYLATSPNQPEVGDALSRHRIGLMCQPASHKPKAGWLWAADNGCFSDGWNYPKWRKWLGSDLPKAGCLFATVPDGVELSYPLAFVLQDGAHDAVIPWRGLDCLFIGGSTEYKMSDEAFAVATEARERGKWVHVGRVNSWSRFEAWAPYADSCDGTFLAFGPRTNFPRLMRWVDRHDLNPQLELA